MEAPYKLTVEGDSLKVDDLFYALGMGRKDRIENKKQYKKRWFNERIYNRRTALFVPLADVEDLLEQMEADNALPLELLEEHRDAILNQIDIKNKEEEEDESSSTSSSPVIPRRSKRKLPASFQALGEEEDGEYEQGEEEDSSPFDKELAVAQLLCQSFATMVRANEDDRLALSPKQQLIMQQNLLRANNKVMEHSNAGYVPIPIYKAPEGSVSVKQRMEQMGHDINQYSDNMQREILLEIGKEASTLYRAQYGKLPPKMKRSDGKISNRYPAEHCADTLDCAITECMEDLNKIDNN